MFPLAEMLVRFACCRRGLNISIRFKVDDSTGRRRLKIVVGGSIVCYLRQSLVLECVEPI
jgi:hypothetical protein